MNIAGIVPDTPLFNTFISDLEGGDKVNMSIGDTKLVMATGQVSTLQGSTAVQQDWERLRAWVSRNLMKFNKNRTKCCSWEGRAHCNSTGWDHLPGKAMRALVSRELSTSQKWAWQQGWPKGLLGCVNRSRANKVKGRDYPLPTWFP